MSDDNKSDREKGCAEGGEIETKDASDRVGVASASATSDGEASGGEGTSSWGFWIAAAIIFAILRNAHCG